MSSPDTATQPNPSPAPSTKSSRPRRRGGPGGPVPVAKPTTTLPSPKSSNSHLSIDMSQLRISDDNASVMSSSTNTSSSSSRRRRRRRNNKNALAKVVENGGGNLIPPIPKAKGSSGGTKKPAKLQIGLNLDVELELKAKLGGDLTLSMVLEEKPKKRTSPEIQPPGEGECIDNELFHMRVGTLRFRRRWIDPDAVLRGQVFLTALSAVVLLGVGFLMGLVVGSGLFSRGGRGGVERLGALQASSLSSLSWSSPAPVLWEESGVSVIGMGAGRLAVDYGMEQMNNLAVLEALRNGTSLY